jgi:hypothetical protein
LQHQYASIIDDVAAQDSGPFTAGSLRFGKLLSALRARDPEGSLPNFLPVRLADIADPEWEDTSRGQSPRRATPDAATLTDFNMAIRLGAVVEVRAVDIDFFSPMFSLEQGEKTRLIFDLRSLNAALLDPSFKMETLLDLPALVGKARFASKIDLKKAYWQVPVDGPLSRRLGCYHPADPSRVFRWQVLPFGLSHAPRIFASITTAFVTAWRKAGISVFAYLDDILILGDTTIEHAQAVRMVVDDLKAAGLRISKEKAFLRPYSVIDFLGLTIDLTDHSFRVPPDKMEKVRTNARDLLRSNQIKVRDALAFIGRIAFLAIAVPFAIFFRAELLNLVGGKDPNHSVNMTQSVRTELTWWTQEATARMFTQRSWPFRQFNHTRLRASRGAPQSTPSFQMSSDASEDGIGLRQVNGKLIGEPLPKDLIGTSSTARELYGLTRLLEMGGFPDGAVIRLLTDSTGAAATANGTSVRAGTAAIARRLFEVAMARNIIVQVEWTPRELLDDEDSASRWSSGSLAFARPSLPACRSLWLPAWGLQQPDVELFACEADRVATCPFMSRVPVRGSIGEALSADWSSFRRAWAYPPFGLIRAVLSKIHSYTTPPRLAILLPDTPMVRTSLRAFRSIEGPPFIFGPPQYDSPHRPPITLRLFISPSLS